MSERHEISQKSLAMLVAVAEMWLLQKGHTADRQQLDAILAAIDEGNRLQFYGAYSPPFLNNYRAKATA